MNEKINRLNDRPLSILMPSYRSHPFTGGQGIYMRLVTKAMRDIEILCSAENIPEIIEVDIAELNLGDSIRLTDLSLPEGSEIPGLTEETDQMIVSVNAPKAVVEEEPLEDDAIGGDEDGADVTDGASDEGSEESEDKKEASE